MQIANMKKEMESFNESVEVLTNYYLTDEIWSEI